MTLQRYHFLQFQEADIHHFPVILPVLIVTTLFAIEFFDNSDAILNFEHIAMHCGCNIAMHCGCKMQCILSISQCVAIDE